MNETATMILLVMALAGILLNMYVVLRLYKFARLEPNRFEHGCGLPLLVMAITDVLTLVGVVVFDVLGFVIIDEHLYHNAILQNFFCKLMIYWMQVTTNVSIWCWVLMSVMRYMAVYHPLLQLRLWHLPRRGVQLIIILSLLLNVSFVGAVQFRERQCQYTSMFGWQTAIRWLNLAEICWGFFIPVLSTMFMDGRVLLTSPPTVLDRRHVHVGSTQPLNAAHLQDSNNTNASKENAASHRGAPRLRKTIFIWLAITSLDLLLNAPDNFLRLALMFIDEKQPVWQWYWPVRVVSQLCYFSQFAINAISLLLVVYDRSIKPSRSATTTALSMVQQSLLTISPSVSASDSATSARRLSSQRSALGCAVEADISDDSQPQWRTSRTHTL